MLNFIYDLIFPATDAILAIGPLAIAGIGAGISALGGLLANRSNNRAMRRMDNRNQLNQIDIPPELQGQIDQLGNSNYFLPLLQRLTANNTQGSFNITSQLARMGVDSPAMARELMQQGTRQRQQSIRGNLDSLEGLRLSALQRSIGQMAGLNQANANLRQRHTENSIGIRGDHAANQMGIINSAISGIGGSITQGLGANMTQGNVNQIMGQSGQSPLQNPMEQFGAGGFAGFGGGNFGFGGGF